MATSTSRRRFLQTAPLAAAVAGLPAVEKVQAQAPGTVPFQLVTAAEIAEHTAELKAKPGNWNFFENTPLPFTCVLTVETAKSAPEFEWHEGRDHIFQILEGETTYELGGTPVHGRNTRPQEWLAPSVTGATTLHLRKGDVLIIPRNTPHRRSTAGSVTFFLFSTTGSVNA